jgi:uncharacterized protein with GYD domain
MVTYVSLMKLTDKGAQDIKNAPERIKSGIANLEAVGGKLVAFYTLIGEYDYLGIAEAPNDQVAAGYLISLSSEGYVRTTTFKAFSMEEFAGILGNLP